MENKAIFLDADGVLNDVIIRSDGSLAAPSSLDEFYIPKEVKPALNRLKSAGYLLVCVTNKPDVKEGLMTQDSLDKIIKKLRSELPLDDLFYCEDRKAACYKPKPGLLLVAAKKYKIDLKKSYMIGDTERDIGAGKNAGCKTIWINRHYPNSKLTDLPNYTVYSLKEAADCILASL